MTKSATRVAADKVTFTQAEVTSAITAGDTAARAGRKNLIINGSMQVAQRGTSLTGLHNNTNYLIDRFSFGGGTIDGRVTMTQDSDGPAGFANSLKLACTTADTSIAASDENYIIYRVEGQDLQQLKKGTASAESMTLSFYVKGNAAATYTAEFYDADNTRQNGQTFNVTTSWNRVTLTYAPDTTGAYTNDNTIGVYIIFWLNTGSNLTSGTFTSNTWASSVQANRVSASNTSFFDSTSRTLNITGVQLEVGSVATDFEHRSYGEELALCQRYYQKYGGASDWTVGTSANYNGSSNYLGLSFINEMRAAPTGSWTNATGWTVLNAGSAVSTTAVVMEGVTTNRAEIYFTTASAMTQGNASWVRGSSSMFIYLDAEL